MRYRVMRPELLTDEELDEEIDRSGNRFDICEHRRLVEEQRERKRKRRDEETRRIDAAIDEQKELRMKQRMKHEQN